MLNHLFYFIGLSPSWPLRLDGWLPLGLVPLGSQNFSTTIFSWWRLLADRFSPPWPWPWRSLTALVLYWQLSIEKKTLFNKNNYTKLIIGHHRTSCNIGVNKKLPHYVLTWPHSTGFGPRGRGFPLGLARHGDNIALTLGPAAQCSLCFEKVNHPPCASLNLLGIAI